MLPVDLADREAFEGIREWVRHNLGISFPDNKLDSLRHRIDSVLRETNIKDIVALHDAVVKPGSPEVLFKVSQAMTTNHTSFFREPGTLDSLFEQLPDEPNTPVRIWSAACSTGEEPYSLAMLAREHYGSRSDGQMAFLATDISHRAIETASTGRYGRTRMGGVSDQRRKRHFTTDGQVYEVSDALKSLVTFRRLNLTVGHWPFRRKFHAIYCRNVLYYFERDLRARVARRLYDHLIGGGYLYTSVTEALRGLDTPWSYVRPGVYRKEGL